MNDQPPARDPVLRLSEEEHVQVDQVWSNLSQRVDAGELTLTLSAGEVRLLLAERAERQQELTIEKERALALRDAVCAIWSSTGAYPHEIPRLAKEALERDNERLDDARRL